MARERAAPETVLVVEDEDDIRDLLTYNLSREGYRVESVADGEDALERARQGGLDLILLDLMLPGRDGIEVCRALKTEPATREIPIIMVTAKEEESDIVLGLGLGADDYVVKPFSPKELVARVRAVLRRGRPRDRPEPQERIVWGGLVVDRLQHRVTVDGKAVELTATQFRLLFFLATHPGRVFTRDQLLDHVIRGGAYVTDRTIDVHVLAIRNRLGPYRSSIETIRGVGYRFKVMSGENP